MFRPALEIKEILPWLHLMMQFAMPLGRERDKIRWEDHLQQGERKSGKHKGKGTKKKNDHITMPAQESLEIMK